MSKLSELERLARECPCKLEIVDGHYPSMIEIAGLPFKISIVTSATDVDFHQGSVRGLYATYLVSACNSVSALLELVREQNAALVAMMSVVEARYVVEGHGAVGENKTMKLHRMACAAINKYNALCGDGERNES